MPTPITPGIFEPSPFEPHRWIRGGHLQTLVPSRVRLAAGLVDKSIQLGPRPIEVEVSDGDRIVLHEDLPARRSLQSRSVLLIHGLTGCHGAPYMIRLAKRLLSQGHCVYRMDMRGFGAARGLSKNLSHAGRSDDVIAGLAAVAARSDSQRIQAVGVSLGGTQLLRAVGRLDAGEDPMPDWYARLAGIASISPPVDLVRCSRAMQQRSLRMYNRYFIRSLIRRVPPKVASRADYQSAIAGRLPRTLWELDDRITAPLSGFRDARHYYEVSSSDRLIAHLRVPTLILAACDDPIVPIECFKRSRLKPSAATTLITPGSGGHVGFVDRRRQSWMDQVILDFLDHAG